MKIRKKKAVFISMILYILKILKKIHSHAYIQLGTKINLENFQDKYYPESIKFKYKVKNI